MKSIHLTEAENNLMQIIWDGEPIPSGELGEWILVKENEESAGSQ